MASEVCEFCNEELEESFFSGSYDSYTESCKCEMNQRYIYLYSNMSDFKKVIDSKKRIEEIKNEIEGLQCELQRKEYELKKALKKTKQQLCE